MPAFKIIYISISIKPVALLFFVILCFSDRLHKFVIAFDFVRNYE